LDQAMTFNCFPCASWVSVATSIKEGAVPAEEELVICSVGGETVASARLGAVKSVADLRQAVERSQFKTENMKTGNMKMRFLLGGHELEECFTEKTLKRLAECDSGDVTLVWELHKTENGKHLIADKRHLLENVEGITNVCDFGIQDCLHHLIDSTAPFPIYAYNVGCAYVSELEFYDRTGKHMGTICAGYGTPATVMVWNYMKPGETEESTQEARRAGQAYAYRHIGVKRKPDGRPVDELAPGDDG